MVSFIAAAVNFLDVLMGAVVIDLLADKIKSYLQR